MSNSEIEPSNSSMPRTDDDDQSVDDIPGQDNLIENAENLSSDQESEKTSSESDSESEDRTIIEQNQLKGQRKGVKVEKAQRISPPFLTKYEKARIIGTRAVQISKNSPIYVDAKNINDPIEIALLELNENKIPFIIRRYLPNGDFEDWEVQELERLD